MSYVRKAVVAGAFALVAALGLAMSDGDITLAEAIASTGAGLIAGAATYSVPNARRP